MPGYLDSALNELDRRPREPKREDGYVFMLEAFRPCVTAAHVANQPWALRWRELRVEKG
jgi:hypothetical protein